MNKLGLSDRYRNVFDVVSATRDYAIEVFEAHTAGLPDSMALRSGHDIYRDWFAGYGKVIDALPELLMKNQMKRASDVLDRLGGKLCEFSELSREIAIDVHFNNGNGGLN